MKGGWGSLTTQACSAAARSSCLSLVQAEEQRDGQGKKMKTKRDPMGPVIVVKLLKTDTTHDLSQKAREDKETREGRGGMGFCARTGTFREGTRSVGLYWEGAREEERWLVGRKR